jgi:hypothetical protein
VTKDSYRRALEEALREYEQLAKQRAEIDQRLSHLIQTIGTLSRLCNLVPTVALGLTDACRMVLKTAGHPLTPAEIRLQLEATGMDLSRYSNPLASIHTVLKRLCQSGEAHFVPRAHSKPAYAWKPGVRIVAGRSSAELAGLFVAGA